MTGGPLGKQVVAPFDKPGASWRCKAFFELAQFLDQGIKQLVAVFQQQGESLSFCPKIVCLLTQAFLFQTCEPAQWHGQHSICLPFAEIEMHHQAGPCLGRISGLLDHGNHLLQ